MYNIEIQFIKEEKRAIAIDKENIIGECEYIEENECWNIIHTGVKNNYTGKGIAKKLVMCVIENAEKNNKKIDATCSYAKNVIDRIQIGGVIK